MSISQANIAMSCLGICICVYAVEFVKAFVRQYNSPRLDTSQLS